MMEVDIAHLSAFLQHCSISTLNNLNDKKMYTLHEDAQIYEKIDHRGDFAAKNYFMRVFDYKYNIHSQISD